MSADWQDGEIVLSVERPSGRAGANRLVMKPLGLAVAGTGCNVRMPGIGLVDLHNTPEAAQEIDLGRVEVTGPQARDLLNRLADETPGLHERFDAGAGALVVMNPGQDVTGLLSGASVNVELRGKLEDAIGYVLNSGLDRATRTAVCPIHHLPEICPRQH